MFSNALNYKVYNLTVTFSLLLFTNSKVQMFHIGARWLVCHLNHDYWKKRNVPYLKPLLLFGNYKESILLKKHQTLVAHDICKHFPGEPYIGTFFGTAPALIVLDPDLIKLILMTDFYYFNGREVNDYTHRETVTKNIFFSGGDTWKIQRQNLTTLYSSSKIKSMFPLIQNCAQQLVNLIEEEYKYSPCIDAKTVLAKFTTDVITSSVFGINSNTMQKEVSGTNPFMMLREKIFDTSTFLGVKLYCRQMWPALFYGLGLTIFDESIHNYFKKILSEVFDTRIKEKSSRNDFIDLILTWKKSNVITGDSMSNVKTGKKKTITLEVNDDLLTSQCVALFGAGLETTSTTMSFALFEIAKNPDIQNKVIEEVDSYLKKQNGVVEYECVHELPYLTACIEEALRLYPVLGIVTREVMDDYTLPTGLRLQKGDRIHIPAYHIHHNPEHFPEPEVYRPERFYGDAKKDIKPFTFFPFGEGPRLCIGMRFSKMPMHAGLIAVFKNYRVELPPGAPRTVQLQTYSIVTTSITPINLNFIPRRASN